MMRKRFIRALLTGRGLLLSSVLLLLACVIAYVAVGIRSGVVVSDDGLLGRQTVAHWLGLAVLAFAATESVRLLWMMAEWIVAGVEAGCRQTMLFRSWSRSKLQSLRPASEAIDDEDIAEPVQPGEDEADNGPEPVESAGDPLAVWARGVMATGSTVTATALIAEFGGDASKATFKRELQKASKRLARDGIGIVPDPRFAYLQQDSAQSIGLIELPEPLERAEVATEAYGDAVFTLSVLAALMHADDNVAEEEVELLAEIAGSFEGLDADEISRVLAWSAHLADNPVAIGRLTRRLKAVDPAARLHLYDLAVCMVQADHRVHPAEVEMLEKVCKSLDIPQADLYRSLGAWRPANASLRPVEAEASTASPADGRETDGSVEEGTHRESAEIIVLDQRRVSSIENDTAEVAVLLSDVFVEEPESAEDAVEPAVAENAAGLDPAHMSLLAWIAERGEVSRESFEEFARANELMPDGALEVLNDWSLERFEDDVVEDGETVAINAALVDSLQLDGVNGGSETDQAARA